MDADALLDGIGDLGGDIKLHALGSEATCGISLGGMVYEGKAKRNKELTMFTRALVAAVHNMLRSLEPAMAAYPESASDHDGDRQQTWFLQDLEKTKSQAAIMWFVQFSGFKGSERFNAALGSYLNETGYWDQ